MRNTDATYVYMIQNSNILVDPVQKKPRKSGDIETGVSQGTPLADTVERPSPGVREESVVKEKSLRREKSHAPRAQISMKKKKSDVVVNNWDVFISYRVKADAKLAEDLYWKLCATDVVDQGSTRRMRVFWDKGRRLLPFSLNFIRICVFASHVDGCPPV